MGLRGKEVWRDSVPSAAGGLVLAVCDELIDGHARRRGPMPVVVVHAAREESDGQYDGAVRELIELVHRAQKPRWLLCRSVDPPVGPDAPPGRPPGDGTRLDDRTYAATTALVKDVAEGPWENHHRCQYRPYRMPRSRLMAALDQALDQALAQALEQAPAPPADTDATPAPPPPPDPRAVVARLARRRWQPARSESDGFWRTLGATLSPATVLGAAAVAVLGVLASKLGAWALAGMALAILLPVAGHLIRRRLPPLWLGSGCRWFATTTFPVTRSTDVAPVWSLWRPRLSGDTLEERAADVVRQLLAAAATDDAGEASGTRESARQFCLQLRTLALLEDLRENHRPAWDFRHRKRTVPPLLLIPRATRANGALPFLRAISDVRSRRSEQDPLLVVAGVAHADLADLRERTPLPLPVRGGYREPALLYEAWVTRSLRTGQAPSMDAALPWLLPVALPGSLLRRYDSDAEINERSTYRVRRSPWLLWSRWTLVAACVLATTTAGGYYGYLHRNYCGDPATLLSRDLVLTPDDECVGVFTDYPLKVAADAPTLGSGGLRIGLAVLQDRITEANDAVDTRQPYITVVFAGALTARSTAEGADDVLRQLAGVYLAQRHFNDSHDALRMRVRIANGAQGMAAQAEMADKIVEYARRDPSVVGVVGMGIHEKSSEAALRTLSRAGLPVVATTNSATHLAEEFYNYVSLAPTNSEQASALVATLPPPTPANARAVVLRPTEEGGADSSYSADQAESARTALDGAKFRVETERYPTYGGGGDFTGAAQKICDAEIHVVYLAGRSTDIESLMSALLHNGCGPKNPVTVLSGDDMTKIRFTDKSMEFPAGTTLRYASLTYGEALESGSVYRAAKSVFGMKHQPVWNDGLFTDGFAALSYDAVFALHEAAQQSDARANGGAVAVLAALHSVELTDVFTGNISFRNADDRHPDRRGHGIGLYEVTQSAKGAPLVVTCLSGRRSGHAPPPEEATCGRTAGEKPADQ
ncbi:ABC-type branched-chain amino acid transport system, substrate-binding protein [Streptomyces sp. yr375]|uniref:ABC transporter substrate-binding protein n=1 Tax=Streptomyces sp. yr375 TaxID=1761906 RepID=UPI0008C245C8|nr:ABC transporter substrate-binding protein [Streptomyces sp. yr375]SER36883.1 ABC-type branched-chain amino acid transport system, substrate-binding protein [Streptomyces sp. yr375]